MTAESTLGQAPTARNGSLVGVTLEFLRRFDNGLVLSTRRYTALVRICGRTQEFIAQYWPQQNGMVGRVIRTLKEQCGHRHRFETLQHASCFIGDWVSFYNHRRPHQARNEDIARGVCFGRIN